MKGINQFIAATMLILIGVVAATLISGWVVQISSERTSTVANRTQSQLACQYASMYASNLTWDCNSNCFTGVPYKINATIENTGNTKLDVYNVFISLTDGTSYRIDGNRTSISTAGVQTKTFNSILVRSTQKIPQQSMDTRRAYGNDTNTMLLVHFDEGSGSTAADSAKNITGTLLGATWGGGRFGSAASFDGTDDSVNTTNSTILASHNLTGKITMEAWIYPTSVFASDTVILKKDNNYQLVIKGYNNGFRCDFWDTAGFNIQYSADNPVLTLNAWQHVACVYDGTYVYLYVNGRIRNLTSYNGGLKYDPSTFLYIGTSDGTGNEFTGRIDEVRISNTSRTFNTTLTYDIVHPNIVAVRVFNETGVQVDAQTSLGSLASYSRNVTNVTTATDYRVEVEDSSGVKIEKWYPAKGGCRSKGTLDRITITTANCPELTDTYYASDVFYVNCVP